MAPDLPTREPPWPRFLLLPAAALVAAAMSALHDGPGTRQVGSGFVEAAAPAPELLGAKGCTGCHGVTDRDGPGGGRAPSLAGALATAARRLASPDYEGLAATPWDYLRESVVDHCTWVVPGYSCSGVQAYGNWLSPEDLEAVVAAVAALPRPP